MILNIDDLMNELAKQRPIFYSEADFQFALGWLIQKNYPAYKVRFEYKPTFDSDMHIDILVITDDQKWIPIELKYKTKKTQEPIIWNNEEYNLSNHSAKDQSCYRYVKDIQRIETVAMHEPLRFIEGYAVMLTNDAAYQKKAKEIACYSAFSIHNNAEISGERDWREGTSDGTLNGMPGPLKLLDTYIMNWKEYSCESFDFPVPFYYLVSTVKKD